MTKQKIKQMLDERIGQIDAHKLEEYEWIVGLMEQVAYEVECDLGAKNMLLETELNALKETCESIAKQRDRFQNNLIDKELEEDEWIVGLMEQVAYDVECDLGAKNMLLETELNALKETCESIAEQRDRLQNNLIDKEEVNSELRQTIIAKQQREIRLEDILAPHQELTQWIEEEMTCEPNSNKFEVSHDFLEGLFYKVVQINH